MLAQAKAHEKAQWLAATWQVPIGELTIGRWRIGPLRGMADLVAEATAMKNCLEDYGNLCLGFHLFVFSIREASTGKRRACCTVARAGRGAPWKLAQVAGKMNADPGDEMRRIAEAVAEEVRRKP